jgi:hypothetical protein
VLARASLVHPNVVPATVERAQRDGLRLAVEQCAAPALTELARPLDGSECARLVAGAGAAIAALEGCGLSTRDITPDHVHFDPARGTLLSDSGLPFELFPPPPVEADAHLAYRSPEELDGSERDARSAVYSLGGVLFTALTCKPPFGGAWSQIYLSHSAPTRPRPTAHLGDLPCELDVVVAQAMAVDPAERYADPGELATALAEALAAAARATERPKKRTKPKAAKAPAKPRKAKAKTTQRRRKPDPPAAPREGEPQPTPTSKKGKRAPAPVSKSDNGAGPAVAPAPATVEPDAKAAAGTSPARAVRQEGLVYTPKDPEQKKPKAAKAPTKPRKAAGKTRQRRRKASPPAPQRSGNRAPTPIPENGDVAAPAPAPVLAPAPEPASAAATAEPDAKPGAGASLAGAVRREGLVVTPKDPKQKKPKAAKVRAKPRKAAGKTRQRRRKASPPAPQRRGNRAPTPIPENGNRAFTPMPENGNRAPAPVSKSDNGAGPAVAPAPATVEADAKPAARAGAVRREALIVTPMDLKQPLRTTSSTTVPPHRGFRQAHASKRRQRRSRSRGRGALGLVIVLAAAAGALAAGLRGDDEGPISARATSGGVSVQLPPEWRVADARAPRLALPVAARLAATTDSHRGATIAVGLVADPGGAEHLVRARFPGSYEHAVARGEPGLLHYSLPASDAGSARAAYVLSTTGPSAIAVCTARTAAGLKACGEVASTVRVLGERAVLPVGPVRDSVEVVLSDLVEDRLVRRRTLADAVLADEQSDAARELQAAYDEAAARVRGDVDAGARAAALLAALEASAAAYAALAEAVAAGDQIAFDDARAAVVAAEAAVWSTGVSRG